MALEWREVKTWCPCWQTELQRATLGIWQTSLDSGWSVDLLGVLEIESVNIGRTTATDAAGAQAEAEALLREWVAGVAAGLDCELVARTTCPDCGRENRATLRGEHTMKGGPPLCHASHSETWDVWMFLQELGQTEAADAVLSLGVEGAREWWKEQREEPGRNVPNEETP